MNYIKQIILFSCLMLFAGEMCYGQEINDSTANNHKKMYFFGVNFSPGLGWRTYKNVSDDDVLSNVYNKGEKPGLSYSLNMNGGFTKEHIQYTLGLEYSCVQYVNSNGSGLIGLEIGSGPNKYWTTTTVIFKYNYTHRFISIPFSVNYFLRKTRKFYLGYNVKISWLFNYFTNVEYADESYHTIDLYHNLTMGDNIAQQSNNYYSPALAMWVGVQCGKNIIETKKCILNIGCKIDYSPIIAYTTKLRDYYPPGAPMGYAPGAREYYESKPHSLWMFLFDINLYQRF